MAIEIRELVIRATVIDENEDNVNQPGQSSISETAPTASEYIIKACVEKVLEILKNNESR